MKFMVCSVRDRAVDQYGAPFFVVGLGQAIRGFVDEVNSRKEGNQMNAHPEDFDLYHLGTFDSDSGLFECGSPRMISVGKDAAAANPQASLRLAG